METKKSFSDVLDEAGNLSLEEQEILIDILQRRYIERRRVELAMDISAAQKEFREGLCKPTTPEELMKEILD